MTDHSEPLFIEYEDVKSLTHLAPDAMVSGVRYRKRPPDAGCLHTHVTFGTPDRGMVDCECDWCHLAWRMVKLWEPVAP